MKVRYMRKTQNVKFHVVENDGGGGCQERYMMSGGWMGRRY